MLNFNDVAKTKVEAVEAVPLPPVGTYRWAITKLPTIRDFKGGDGTEYQAVEFPIQVVAPSDDVDASEYKGNLTDIRQNLSFMFNRSDEVAFLQMQNRLKRFLINHLKVGGEDESFNELFNKSVRQQFLAPITWAPDKNDPEVLRVRLGNTAPLD
jgi:hypothetical protein